MTQARNYPHCRYEIIVPQDKNQRIYVAVSPYNEQTEEFELHSDLCFYFSSDQPSSDTDSENISVGSTYIQKKTKAENIYTYDYYVNVPLTTAQIAKEQLINKYLPPGIIFGREVTFAQKEAELAKSYFETSAKDKAKITSRLESLKPEPVNQPEVHEIFEEIESGNFDKVRSMIRKNPDLLNKRRADGATPLLVFMYKINQINTNSGTKSELNKILNNLIIGHYATINFTELTTTGDTILHFALDNPYFADVAFTILNIMASQITENKNPLKTAMEAKNGGQVSALSNWVMGYISSLNNNDNESCVFYKDIFDLMTQTNSLNEAQKVAIGNDLKNNVEYLKKQKLDPLEWLTTSPIHNIRKILFEVNKLKNYITNQFGPGTKEYNTSVLPLEFLSEKLSTCLVYSNKSAKLSKVLSQVIDKLCQIKPEIFGDKIKTLYWSAYCELDNQVAQVAQVDHIKILDDTELSKKIVEWQVKIKEQRSYQKDLKINYPAKEYKRRHDLVDITIAYNENLQVAMINANNMFAKSMAISNENFQNQFKLLTSLLKAIAKKKADENTINTLLKIEKQLKKNLENQTNPLPLSDDNKNKIYQIINGLPDDLKKECLEAFEISLNSMSQILKPRENYLSFCECIKEITTILPLNPAYIFEESTDGMLRFNPVFFSQSERVIKLIKDKIKENVDYSENWKSILKVVQDRTDNLIKQEEPLYTRWGEELPRLYLKLKLKYDQEEGSQLTNHQEITDILNDHLLAYENHIPIFNFFKPRSFTDADCKTILENWKSNEQMSVKDAFRLIYWQLNHALLKVTPNFKYYGEFGSQFGYRGKMIPILEKVKSNLEEKYHAESEFYKIIYMEFQKYLNPKLGSASGTFTYTDIFGPNGYAERIFNECNNRDSLTNVIGQIKKEALKKRANQWGQRKNPLDKLPFLRDRSDMVKTLDKIGKLLIDKKLMLDSKNKIVNK